jgi:hypothetical protein
MLATEAQMITYLRATITVDNPVSTKARTIDKCPCTAILSSSPVDLE